MIRKLIYFNKLDSVIGLPKAFLTDIPTHPSFKKEQNKQRHIIY